MIKRHIPPHVYKGPRPPGFRFIRFEETGPTIVGITDDGRRVVIPQKEWWVEYGD